MLTSSRLVLSLLSVAVAAANASSQYSSNSTAQENYSSSQPKPTSDIIEEIIVWGRYISQLGQAKAASEGLIGYADLSTRPLLRPGELIEVFPGTVAPCCRIDGASFIIAFGGGRYAFDAGTTNRQ